MKQEPAGGPHDAAHRNLRPSGRRGCQRFTPACAGKGWSGSSSRRSALVHPRMCGEGSWPNWRTKASVGSPPHVRGRAIRIALSPVPSRFTPACAGKGMAGNHWNKRQNRFAESSPPSSRICYNLHHIQEPWPCHPSSEWKATNGGDIAGREAFRIVAAALPPNLVLFGKPLIHPLDASRFNAAELIGIGRGGGKPGVTQSSAAAAGHSHRPWRCRCR